MALDKAFNGNDIQYKQDEEIDIFKHGAISWDFQPTKYNQISQSCVRVEHPNLTGSDPKMVLCEDYTSGWASFYSSINQNQQVCLSIFLRAAK